MIAGLLRFPDQIARHAEGLLALREAEPRLSPAINALLAGPMALEEHRPDPILAAKVLTPSPDSTCFSFLVEGSDPQGAREDLAEAIALLVERPALEAAIVAATARFETDPQGAFAEQQRLRKRKLEFDLRLGQMARKRAAPPAVAGDEAAADTHPSGDQTTD